MSKSRLVVIIEATISRLLTSFLIISIALNSFNMLCFFQQSSRESLSIPLKNESEFENDEGRKSASPMAF